MKLNRALIAGVLGALIMSLAMLVLRLAGIPVSLEPLLGSLVTSRSSDEQWIAGVVLHLVIGALAGIGYAVVFEWGVQQASAMIGAGVGLCHGLFAELLMSGIPEMNPLGLASHAAAPGPFLQNLHFGPFNFVLLHCLFGACVGALYGTTVQHEHVPASASGRKA